MLILYCYVHCGLKICVLYMFKRCPLIPQVCGFFFFLNQGC